MRVCRAQEIHSLSQMMDDVALGAFSLSAQLYLSIKTICNSYTMGCPPVRGDNPRALASGLSYVQVDKHGITILYHLH